MNNSIKMNIAAVERDTGLGKDTLRVWERRYGFPQPERDANGERLYPAEQIERLRLIKRLMDQGHRPGRLFSVSEDELLELADMAAARAGRDESDTEQPEREIIQQIIDRLKAHDTSGLRQALSQAMVRQGLQRFILGTMAPLNQAIGDAWMRGELRVFEEHLYTEQIKSLLRQTIASLPGQIGGRPRVLLTTVPDELHVLGVLMAECLLTLEGATCISLGPQTPLTDIRQAAEAHRADIVALSFSSAFSTRLIAPLLAQLRQLLPASVHLWAGGATLERLPASVGVLFLPGLDNAIGALQDWRDEHGSEIRPVV